MRPGVKRARLGKMQEDGPSILEYKNLGAPAKSVLLADDARRMHSSSSSSNNRGERDKIRMDKMFKIGSQTRTREIDIERYIDEKDEVCFWNCSA